MAISQRGRGECQIGRIRPSVAQLLFCAPRSKYISRSDPAHFLSQSGVGHMSPSTSKWGIIKPVLLNGQAFGQYALLARLARGGMGEILLAQKRGIAGFEKLVVIKRLLPHLMSDASFTAMFINEARVAAQLNHPNVCQVYELGQEDDQYFISMEYLQGISLSALLRETASRGRVLEPRFVLGLLTQACEGLHHAHELVDVDGTPRGLVHRDLTPSNIFVTSDGIVKILDFGIAKVRGALAKTRTGTIKGKYAYMSPEQLAGQPLDRRSDVFSLGIVLYESLTCTRLFKRQVDHQMFRAITTDPIPRADSTVPQLPRQVGDVVARALERDPSRRFETARNLAEALTEAGRLVGGTMSPTAIGQLLGASYGRLLAEQDSLLRGARAAAESGGEETKVTEESPVPELSEPTAATRALPQQTGAARVDLPLVVDESEQTTTCAPAFRRPSTGQPYENEPPTRVHNDSSESERVITSTASVRTKRRWQQVVASGVFIAAVVGLAVGGIFALRWWQNQERPGVPRFERALGELQNSIKGCLRAHPGLPAGSRLSIRIGDSGVADVVEVVPKTARDHQAARCAVAAGKPLIFGASAAGQSITLRLR